MENTAEQPTGQATRNKNKKWQDHHAAITDAYVKCIAIYGRQPKLKEIQDELARTADASDPNKVAVKIGMDTICEHLKDFTFKPQDTELKILTPQVLLNIFNSSKKSAASQKLWFQIVENWKEGTEVTGAGGTPLIPETYDYSKFSPAELVTFIQLAEKAKVTNDNSGTVTGG